MANKDQSPLKGWEYPAGSGIRIREVINRYKGKDFGVSYRVSIPTKLAGRRILKQFADPDKAEVWAKAQYEGLKAKGQQHFVALSSSQRDDALKALSVLGDLGISLTEAARIAKIHYRPAEALITVKEANKLMLVEKEAANLRKQSLRDLRNRMKYFAERFGESNVHEIKAEEIQTWLDELKGVSAQSINGLSPRSKKNYVVTLKTFFNFCISKGYRSETDNPTKQLIIPKIDWEVPSVLTVEESENLVSLAHHFESGKLLGFVTLGLFAGIRTAELHQLTWDDIDLDEGIVTIGAAIAKKRRLRIIELMPNAIAWLKLCPRKSGRVSPDRADLLMADLVRKAGFKNWKKEKFNAMRHSFGTYHFALYQDAALTSSALGHRANDQVLFDSYRSLARKKDGEAYFAIKPSSLT